MKKELRLEVYNQYDRHCAYCGKILEYKKMQVDHIISQRNGGTDAIENLRPSCRRCNHYKRASSVESFRDSIQKIPAKLSEIYIVKVAIDYGLIQFHEKPIEFYFEKVAQVVVSPSNDTINAITNKEKA